MIKKVTNHLKNNFKIYLVVLIFFLSLILFITLSYAKYSILETKIIKTSVIIGDTPGFDLNSTTLTLGRNDTKTFYISANNNINASYGEYSGEIIVIIKRDF